MTPLQIEMLLHYHSRATDYPNLSSPAQVEAIGYFLMAGFLEEPNKGQTAHVGAMRYIPTEKLHAYCEALCNVPEPKQIWIVEG